MVEHGAVSPEWKPLITLLETILGRVWEELEPWHPRCVAVTAGHAGETGPAVPVKLAALGAGASFIDAQLEHGGPVVDAMASGEPMSTDNVWAEPRWHALAQSLLAGQAPGRREVWASISGMAVVPSGGNHGGGAALSCCVPGPAAEPILEVLNRYEPLVAASLAVVHASTVDGADDSLRLLRSRAVIEQAKGAIVAASGCDAHSAWVELRTASQNFNIKLRDIAVALIEHIGQAPAEQPAGLPFIRPDDVTRDVARRTWQELTGR
ncbi:ANTAR domain-containing protein [Amycolatopsis magusensis]|uniref:ANTAR domain-containing protein n=1 Tax=Amycolatopsis magusensis TaxID=882444 RepID=UPI003792CAFB